MNNVSNKRFQRNRAIKKKKRISLSISNNNKRKINFVNNIRRKAIRLVLVIIILFLIQWSPFWIFQISMLFTTSLYENIYLINMLVSTLSYSNTVANPALYMLLTYNFKKYIQKTLFGKLFEYKLNNLLNIIEKIIPKKKALAGSRFSFN